MAGSQWRAYNGPRNVTTSCASFHMQIATALSSGLHSVADYSTMSKMPLEAESDSFHAVKSYVLKQLSIHREKHAATAKPPPLFVGLSGVQGSGKTTLVR